MADDASRESRPWTVTDRAKTPRQQFFAKRMRREPTEAEQKLWWHLRRRLQVAGTHFRRQVQIGPFIVDFVCHSRKLIIEIDGGHHSERHARDTSRTTRLAADGYRVLRFWNNDVLSNVDGVLEEIGNVIATTPTPDPSPQGGGENSR